jgi:hypothetical protein
MKTYFYICLSLLLLTSCTGCKPSVTDGTRLLDYGYFTIRVPQEWKRVDIKGIDSFVGEINIDSSKAISFDMGWFCDTLGEGLRTKYYQVESGNIYTPDNKVKQDLNDPTYWRYFAKADSNTIERLKRNTITWTTIDHYRAKMVKPKRAGLGITGVYIDSLWQWGDHPADFVLSGRDLTSKQQQQLITAIRTLKFYQHPDKRERGKYE